LFAGVFVTLQLIGLHTLTIFPNPPLLHTALIVPDKHPVGQLILAVAPFNVCGNVTLPGPQLINVGVAKHIPQDGSGLARTF